MLFLLLLLLPFGREARMPPLLPFQAAGTTRRSTAAPARTGKMKEREGGEDEREKETG